MNKVTPANRAANAATGVGVNVPQGEQGVLFSRRLAKPLFQSILRRTANE